MAIYITANGEVTSLKFNKKEDHLKRLQTLVGGTVEFISINPAKSSLTKFNDHSIMAVNEDGRCLDLNTNRKASNIVGQYIVGDVVLLTTNEA